MTDANVNDAEVYLWVESLEVTRLDSGVKMQRKVVRRYLLDYSPDAEQYITLVGVGCKYGDLVRLPFAITEDFYVRLGPVTVEDADDDPDLYETSGH